MEKARSPQLSSVVLRKRKPEASWSERTRGKRHQLSQGTEFHHEGGQTLEQAVQKGCAISILRGVQNSTGHGPEQPCPAQKLPSLDKEAGPNNL